MVKKGVGRIFSRRKGLPIFHWSNHVAGEKVHKFMGLCPRCPEGKVNDLEFRIAAFLDPKGLYDLVFLLLDFGKLVRDKKCGWTVSF